MTLGGTCGSGGGGDAGCDGKGGLGVEWSERNDLERVADSAKTFYHWPSSLSPLTRKPYYRNKLVY